MRDFAHVDLHFELLNSLLVGIFFELYLLFVATLLGLYFDNSTSSLEDDCFINSLEVEEYELIKAWFKCQNKFCDFNHSQLLFLD